MNYNLYLLKDNFEVIPKNDFDLNSEIKRSLDIIDKEIVSEFLKKQEGKIGIKNLGNEIRYNKSLKAEFKSLKKDKIIIKITENRRSFIKIFIDNWIDYNEKEIYYFILESTFGVSSKIVDGSFIRINDIKEELSRFHNYFSQSTIGPKVYFIEMKGFKNYIVIDNNGYTRLQQKNNKNG